MKSTQRCLGTGGKKVLSICSSQGNYQLPLHPSQSSLIEDCVD